MNRYFYFRLYLPILSWYLTSKRKSLQMIAKTFLYIDLLIKKKAPEAAEIKPESANKAMFSRGERKIIDVFDHETGLGAYTGKSFSELRKSHHDLEIMPESEANTILDRMAVTDPVFISIRKWNDEMSKHPIKNFKSIPKCDEMSFNAGTYVRGSIVECFVRIDGNIVSFNDFESTTHEDRIEKSRAWIKDHPGQNGQLSEWPTSILNDDYVDTKCGPL